MFKEHTFTIRLGGQDYDLKTGFSFTRSLDLMNAAFEISLIDPEYSLIQAFRPGLETQLLIDDLVLAQVNLDSISIDDSNGHVYTYRGRDRAGDLIDCSAQFSNGGFELKNVTLEQAVKDVLKPFKMDVKVVGDVGAKFDKLSITPGDTVFNFIDQTCRYRALLPLSDGLGGLILTKPGSQKSSGMIATGEAGNVKSRSGQIDHFSRFSKVIVKGQAEASGFGFAEAETLATPEGSAVDPDITRHRPLIIQAEREGYDLSMKERAEWEVRHRRFKGTELTYTLPGWQASDGELWKINTLVPVRDKELNIARDMLIKDVTLSRGEDGTISQITVAPAEAFDLPPVKQSGDDPVWGGGL